MGIGQYVRAYKEALYAAGELCVRLFRTHNIEYGAAGGVWRDSSHRGCVYS